MRLEEVKVGQYLWLKQDRVYVSGITPIGAMAHFPIVVAVVSEPRIAGETMVWVQASSLSFERAETPSEKSARQNKEAGDAVRKNVTGWISDDSKFMASFERQGYGDEPTLLIETYEWGSPESEVCISVAEVKTLHAYLTEFLGKVDE